MLGQYGLLVAIELVVIYLAGLEFHTFTTRRYARRPSLRRLRQCAASHRHMLRFCAPLASTGALTAAWAFGLELTPIQQLSFALVVASGSVAQEVGRFMVLVNKPVAAVVMAFVRTAAWQPLVVPFIEVDGAVSAMLGLWAAVSIAGTLWGLWTMRAALGPRTPVRWRYLVRGVAAARGYFLVASASVLQGNLERFVLQAFLGPAAVGVFAFYQTLANTLPALVQSAVLNVWLSPLLGSYGQRLPDRTEVTRRLMRRCLRVGLWVSVVICAAAWPLAMMASHAEYRQFVWMLPVLLAGQLLLMWSQPLHLALYASHHDRPLTWVSLLMLVLSLTVSIALIDRYGVAGAVVSPLLSAGVLTALRGWMFGRSMVRGTL